MKLNKFVLFLLEAMPWVFWFGFFFVMSNKNWLLSLSMAATLFFLNKVTTHFLNKVDIKK